MAQYGCVSITANANENVVPLIFKELTGNVPTIDKRYLKFVGFEAPQGTEFFINGVPNKVPSNEICITPYDTN